MSPQTRILRLLLSMIAGCWLILAVNPQIYIYVLLNPDRIVLYMDVLDVDEDIFYYYQKKGDSGSSEWVFQEEVKRDGVKKRKSFLKSKALQIIASFESDWILFAPAGMRLQWRREKPILLQAYHKPFFHPPELKKFL